MHLSNDQLKQIIELQMNKLEQKLSEMDITLSINDSAKTLLAKLGYSTEYGARPLLRVIQSKIENNLSDLILRGEITNGGHIDITSDGNEFYFNSGGN